MKINQIKFIKGVQAQFVYFYLHLLDILNIMIYTDYLCPITLFQTQLKTSMSEPWFFSLICFVIFSSRWLFQPSFLHLLWLWLFLSCESVVGQKTLNFGRPNLMRSSLMFEKIIPNVFLTVFSFSIMISSCAIEVLSISQDNFLLLN